MQKTHLLSRILTLTLTTLLALTACGAPATQPVQNTPQPPTQHLAAKPAESQFIQSKLTRDPSPAASLDEILQSAN